MKVWIHVFIFAASTLAVLSQTCPSEHFSAVFVVSIDQTIDDLNIILDDPELTFFKDTMNFEEHAIQDAFEYAIHFFNESYGLDFSASSPNKQNERFFENAKMSPFFFSDKLEFIVTANNWIRNGNTRSRCYRMHNGGIRVTFSGDQTLYGSYGGTEGKPAGMTSGATDLLYSGIFKIDACQQSPVVIFYRSAAPTRIEPVDRTVISIFDVKNDVLGRGKSHGVASLKPDKEEPGKFHLTLRNVLTF